MGCYNQSSARLRCPRCGNDSTCIVDLYFGDTSNMLTIPIGTPYPFHERETSQNSGLLPTDTPHGPGYTECPICGKDFYCLATIEDQTLVGIQPDLTELPLIPDSELNGEANCPVCSSHATRTQLFTGFPICRLICDSCNSISLSGESDRIQ